MNTRPNTQGSHQAPARAIHRWVWLAALTALATVSVGRAAVEIDQTPLTAKTSLPPNIVLLLDDSLSMPNSVMPDEPSATTADALISSSVNGVYYNPATEYLAPYNADGTTRFATYPFSAAPLDGFGATVATTDVTNIAIYGTGLEPLNIAMDQCSVFTAQLSGNTLCYPNSRPKNVHVFQIDIPAAYQYDATKLSCGSGTNVTAEFSNLSYPGKCTVADQDPTCPNGYTRTGTGTASVACVANTATPTCNSGYTFNSSTALCQRVVTQDPTCPSGTRTGTGTTAVTCFQTATPTCPSGHTLQTADESGLTGNQKGQCRKGTGKDSATGTGCSSGSTFRAQCYTTDPSCTSPLVLNKHQSDSSTPACEYNNTPSLVCATGYTKDFNNVANPGKCVQTQTQTPTCTSPLTLVGSQCTMAAAATPACPTNYTADFSDSTHYGKCQTLRDPTCPTSPYNVGPFNTGTTSVTCGRVVTAAYAKYRSLFVYAVKEANGTYTRHYVGAETEDTSAGNASSTSPTAGTCTNLTTNTVTNLSVSPTESWTSPNFFPTARCHDTATVRQNVSNWFSYYRTRLLLAKSGLMNAFHDIDPTIRFGFGAINGDYTRSAGTRNELVTSANETALPTPKTTDTANLRPQIAMVQPIGDGTTGTHKADFWNWTKQVKAAGSTPLRASLEAAGRYYQNNDQPWLTDVDDASSDLLACRQSYTILTTDGFWNTDTTSISAYSGNLDGGPSATTTQDQNTPATCPNGYTLQTSDNSSLSGNQKGTCRIGTGRGPTTGTATLASCNSSSSSSFQSRCYLSYTSSQMCPAVASGETAWTYDSANDVRCERTVTIDNSVTITGPNEQEYIYTATPPYSDSYSNTLADIAMYYWLTDLRTDLENNVPDDPPDDPAFWQHMTTFTVGLFDQNLSLPGITPTGTTYDQINTWATSGGTPNNFAWPDIINGDDSYKITDLVHAGVNGHGGFYSAGTPEAFANGLADALKRVNARTGTGASLAANSTKLQNGTTTYQALYYTADWEGDLKAFEVDEESGAILETTLWSVADSLPLWSSRNIKTYNPSGTTDAQKFPAFTGPSVLSTAQQGALGSSQNLINYLRGDETNSDGGNGTDAYRARDSALGDIVSSQPVYVGAPNSAFYVDKDFTGSDSYADFVAAQSERTALIWVAANDGMLHAINAANGVEVFAYLPNAVILNGIEDLASISYGGNAVPHQYYNDGEMTVADAFIDNEWKTVLVGTTGRGPAKAVYALDITDPADVKFLWERASGDAVTNSNYIGQIIGKPVIAQTGDQNWSVLIGNGFNSTINKAALLQFDLLTGALTVHQTPGSAINNGLAPPAVWIDDPTDAISTTAWAGDFAGDVWEFDLSDSDSDGVRLFNGTQPITGGMLAGKDPDKKNVWVFFGTGQYLTQDDLEDKTLQSWYGMIVEAGAGQPASLVSNLLSSGRAALVERTIEEEVAPNASADPPTVGTRTLSDGDVTDMDNKSGWYMDLVVDSNEKGERTVTPNQFQGNLLLGTTRIPGVGSDPCNPSGDGWIMALNPFTGAAPDETFFDSNGDGVFDEDDKMDGSVVAGIGFTSIPNNPIFVGNVMLTSFDDATTSSILTAGSTGAPARMSWRELVEQ